RSLDSSSTRRRPRHSGSRSPALSCCAPIRSWNDHILEEASMSFIQTVPESDATGKLRDLYETERTNRGYVPNHLKPLNLRPDATEACQRRISGTGAPRALRRYELVTIAAAAALRCSY